MMIKENYLAGYHHTKFTSKAMQTFSQRKGLKPVKSVMQVEDMDDDLRNSLWNSLTRQYWNSVDEGYPLRFEPPFYDLCLRLWSDLFKLPTDTMPLMRRDVLKQIRAYFFQFRWYEVYDFIEFVAITYSSSAANTAFINSCNSVLERESSAYRFVGGRISQITSEEEIAAIESALSDQRLSSPITNHLRTALNLLTDRSSPDYRNSIKESISAVEAMCNIIVGARTTLGQTLKQIESKVEIHPALRSAFSSIYGYTSDAGGIRHALLDEPNLDFEDAKFMLVSCSAFINYLTSKAAKAGITL
jgi:hypothetical protein